jgi:hypothetical protein
VHTFQPFWISSVTILQFLIDHARYLPDITLYQAHCTSNVRVPYPYLHPTSRAHYGVIYAEMLALWNTTPRRISVLLPRNIIFRKIRYRFRVFIYNREREERQQIHNKMYRNESKKIKMLRGYFLVTTSQLYIHNASLPSAARLPVSYLSIFWLHTGAHNDKGLEVRRSVSLGFPLEVISTHILNLGIKI